MPKDRQVGPKEPLMLIHVDRNTTFPEKLPICHTLEILAVSRYFHNTIAPAYCIWGRYRSIL